MPGIFDAHVSVTNRKLNLSEKISLNAFGSFFVHLLKLIQNAKKINGRLLSICKTESTNSCLLNKYRVYIFFLLTFRKSISLAG